VEKRRMCPNCRAFITTDDKTCPYCQAQVGPRAVDRRSTADAIGGLIPQARFTTMVIMLINTGLYIVTVLYSMKSGANGIDPSSQTLFLFGGKYGPAIAQGQWWRLVTAGFLHGGILHILMNMWVLFDLGAQVEEVCGTSRMLVIYLFSNITGFYVSTYFSFSTLSIGASAAIFGLIGGMIGVGLRDRTSYGQAIRRFFMRWAIYGLVMSIIPGLGVDLGAHVGGLIGGFLIGFIAATPGYSQPVERAWQIAAGVMMAITGFAFFRMIEFMIQAMAQAT
jgi:rhomboid protease GluP